MITYNHESYIQQAIEGVLIQESDFKYELVIGEDNSTDSTKKIIQVYQKKYPEIIKPLFRSENIGMIPNLIDTIKNSKGKYIALCEGDDYWTDPCKLQKQLDFLEDNKDFVLVGHPSEAIYENSDRPPEIYHHFDKDVLRKRDIISSYRLQAASVVFRREVLNEKFLSEIRGVEHSLYIYLSHYGKFKVLPEVMSVYRLHNKGVSGTSTPDLAYPKQLEWINNLKGIMGKDFFWGFHFLSSKVHTHYAIKHPHVFKKKAFFKYLYFFKYAFLMVGFYPRNIRSVLCLVPDLIKSKTKA